ncbi:MAG: NAD+ synthase [Betaproteobacteria bacterium]|nr:NAD+ synthase [Betaproteobacteria bacterium]
MASSSRERIRIALAQINCTVGDLTGNASRIRQSVEQARVAGADLVLAPELALCGYPPEDLLLREGFFHDCRRELERLAVQVRGITAVVGFPELLEGGRYNSAAVIRDGRIVACARKHDLPNYEVFDEKRYFSSWNEPCIVEIKGTRFGLTICEDVWWPEAPAMAKAAGAQVILSINASPYHKRKQATRHKAFREWIRETHLPMVYVNMVGGQDELVFDGASCVLDGSGEVVRQAPFFDSALEIVEFDGARPVAGPISAELPVEAEVYRALVVGTRDYVQKNGFPGALLGLSGGVDSALTLAIACDALGADKLRAVMMPTQYTARMSLDDAKDMARRLDVRYDVIGIRPVFDSFLAALAGEFRGRPADLTEENLQARIRGTILMSLSNKFGSMVLTTGNKSEMAVGYSTLYGDMAGGYAVIKDIAKTLVWRLARYRNTVSDVIPANIITRAPSAELRDNQTDQDSLPAYEVLDAIMEAYMEHNRSPREIVAQGHAVADVRRVVELIRRSEYKRRQSPPVVRITFRCFGKDWRYPITSHYRDTGDLT